MENQTAPATAVCRRCGAAVCAEHAHVATEVIHHFAGMGPATRPLPARRITCTTCFKAEHSATPGAEHSADSGTAGPRRQLTGDRR